MDALSNNTQPVCTAYIETVSRLRHLVMACFLNCVGSKQAKGVSLTLFALGCYLCTLYIQMYNNLVCTHSNKG